MTPADETRLASIAAQFVARVHDDDPDANGQWLDSVTDANDRRALPYVLAAMVPTDKTIDELLSWICPPVSSTGLSTGELDAGSGRSSLYEAVVVERFGPRPGGRRAA